MNKRLRGDEKIKIIIWWVPSGKCCMWKVTRELLDVKKQIVGDYPKVLGLV